MARLARLRDEAVAAPADVETGSSRPARLLAALPAGAPAPEGVVDRALAEARARGREIQVVAVGPAALPAARRVEAMFRARGVAVHVGEFKPLNQTASRVELYLLP